MTVAPSDTSRPLTSENEIQAAYAGAETAARYVEQRFQSGLHRLLHERQVALVQETLDRIGTGSALEIAPGPGRVTRDVRPSGSLTCLEFNSGMIAQGRAACPPTVNWVQGNAFELPFTEPFDLIYTFRFVRHFQLPDRRRLYEEVRRVLKPGGYFILDAVNEETSRPLREASPEQYPVYDELYREESLRAELGDAGFADVQLTPVQKCVSWQYRSQVLIGPRSSWLNWMIIQGLERLPFRSGLEWIVRCVRRG